MRAVLTLVMFVVIVVVGYQTIIQYKNCNGYMVKTITFDAFPTFYVCIEDKGNSA